VLHVRPARGQVPDLVKEIRLRAERNERVLVTTLTKRLAEDLSAYLLEGGLRCKWLHSELDAIERVQVLRELREGAFDVLVGVTCCAKVSTCRSVAGDDPRRRQGGLPAQRDFADSDHRPGRPPCERGSPSSTRTRSPSR